METLEGIGSHGHLDDLDFMNFSQSNGIPQESKLLTYLSGRGNATEEGLSKNIASLALDDAKIKAKSLQAAAAAANELLQQQRSSTPQTSSMSHSASSPSFPAFQRGFSIDPALLRNGDHGSAFPALSSATGNLPLSLGGAGRLTPSPGLAGISSPSRHTPQHSPPSSRQRSPAREASTALSLYQENVNGTTYFYPQANGPVLDDEIGVGVMNGGHSGRMSVPLAEVPGVVLPDYHVYPGQSAHVSNMHPKANVPSFFMSDELRAALLHQQTLRLAHADPEVYPDLPQELDKYHDLCPLEHLPSSPHHKSIVFGCFTSTYKATSSKNGEQYAIKRVHGFRLTSSMNVKAVQAWRDLQHSNVVQFREVFTSKVFGDNSLVLVYDYHPAAETMQSRHFNGMLGPSASVTANPFTGGGADISMMGRTFHSSGKAPGLRQHSGLLPESLIWNYVIQISSALRTIHAAGLAYRCLHPSKILITHKSRVRLSCVGMADLISATDSPGAVHAFQQEDLVALGKLILALACNNLLALQSRESMQAAMEIIGRNYSVDLRNLINYLMFNNQRPKAVLDIMPMIGARFYTQLDSAMMRTDVVEAELSKELENGRLFRMIAKICSIVDRAEFNLDPAWSETGDRYMLKLFRDYVFHQVTDEGQPWIDLSHVVYCLNRVEAGSREKIALMSRDEQNILVVSYAELKHCLEQSWAELESSSVNVNEGGSLPRGGPARTDLAHSATASVALPGSVMGAAEGDPSALAGAAAGLGRGSLAHHHLGAHAVE